MPPWQGGGNMIADVTFEKTIYQPRPSASKPAPATSPTPSASAPPSTTSTRIGMENIARHEHELLVYATSRALRIPGLCIIGTAKEKAGVLSFVLDGYRTEDVGAASTARGIAVRSGHHCAQPILRRFGQETTVRPRSPSTTTTRTSTPLRSLLQAGKRTVLDPRRAQSILVERGWSTAPRRRQAAAGFCRTCAGSQMALASSRM
jgi:selenocysteine lyase/cysteine desulfurase